MSALCALCGRDMAYGPALSARSQDLFTPRASCGAQADMTDGSGEHFS